MLPIRQHICTFSTVGVNDRLQSEKNLVAYSNSAIGWNCSFRKQMDHASALRLVPLENGSPGAG